MRKNFDLNSRKKAGKHKEGNLFHQVGDLSLKGRVGKADSAPVSGWQPDSKTVGNNKLPLLIWFPVS
jgi:hypothetical protein